MDVKNYIMSTGDCQSLCYRTKVCKEFGKILELRDICVAKEERKELNQSLLQE
jgi:hypothetical protein